MLAENLSPVVEDTKIAIEYATVQGVGENNSQFVVQSTAGYVVAKRAFSCVIQPEAGDKVMLSRDAKNQAHILAIIERVVGNTATLGFDGDLNLHSKNGKVSVTAGESINIAAAKKVTLFAEHTDIIAKKALINIEELSAVGKELNSHIGRVKVFAHSIDTVADRVTQYLKNSFRIIDGVDQTRAGEMLSTIKNLFSLRARQAAVLAKKDMKIDAERIHMG